MSKFIIFLCLVFLLSGCSYVDTSNQNTGMSVEYSKFVGSRDTVGFGGDLKVYEDLNAIYDESELVIVGTVKNLTEVSETFNDETLYASKISVEIVELLKGDIATKSLNVLQTGKPNSDDYETKLKKDNSYILFLNSKKFNGETVYDCTGIEQGIFEIKQDGNLYSYVDFGISATFDNKSTNILKEELRKDYKLN